MEKVIFIVGPTASGKSALSLSLAKKIKAEIISADSMQVYKHLDIVTAKPTKSQLKQVPHHLINIIEPFEEFNVARYCELVAATLKKIRQQKKKTLIVGGTGLYLKALIEGIFVSPPLDPQIREKLKKQAMGKSSDFLYNKLKKVDKKSAEKIHANDQRRILRALEVYQATGRTLSSWQKNKKGIIKNFLLIGLNWNRKELYQRIEERIDRMFRQGAVKEIENLLKKEILTGKTACQALGCKEIIGYLEKKYSLLETKKLLKRNTRRYAKRQLTWFKREKRINWIDLKKKTPKDEIIKKILTLI
jgi:tRNA dimethylallyltransferase